VAKIKHTKNELKAQKEALTRFERFLPMLLLKKQQLQAEIQKIDTAIREKQEKEKTLLTDMRKWVKVFSEPSDLEKLIRLRTITTEEGNIAGVPIPVLTDLDIAKEPYDLFTTPTWYDDAMVFIDQLIRLGVEIQTLEEQKQLIMEELRTTSQRVNLFEKVKIPECKENIRVIKVFLGDEQTAAVARGKNAKKRLAA